jgi:ribosomal protein S18 acetylase RimI-like enzyme
MSLRLDLTDAATTRDLRRSVLRPQQAPGSPMHGDDATDALHLGAFDGDAVVGCCVLLPRPYPSRPDEEGGWQLRGMAVAPAVQGQGVGRAVLDAAVAEARRRRGTLLWCDARTSAVGFYRSQGFTTDGAEFVHAESGLPHHRMWRRIDPRALPNPVRGRFPAG